jgi:GTP-binding protein HflX
MSAGGARIGTRGPGETQLEVDRRRLVRRIHRLESELREIDRHRATQRKAQRRSRMHNAVIVGYTNAGKSTLLNRLTDAGVLVEDRLFATLDATTRRLALPGGESLLLTDTVGFIRKLPHQLVEAFKSTLDVAVDADLLVHVVDASAPDPTDEIDAVRDVLHSIGAESVPELLVFNKADVSADAAARLAGRHDGSVVISAKTGDGVETLLQTIGDRLRAMTQVVELAIPFDRGDVLAAVHREGEVLVELHDDDRFRVRARIDDAAAGRFRDYVVSPAAGAAP